MIAASGRQSVSAAPALFDGIQDPPVLQQTTSTPLGSERPAESTGRRAVIIGAGVIGTACAHFLSESGWQVTLVDRGRFAGACSHGNCGLVCPSHVLPLAEPGAIQAALKALLSRSAPFRIQPRLDFSLWAWLWKFALRCNQRQMLESGAAIQALLESSMTLYHQLVHDVGLDCEWQERGLLFVYQSAAALDQYAQTNQLLAEVFHEPAQRLGPAEVVALEPSLRDDVAGGWYYEHDAHLRPDRLMASWRQRLEARGTEFREHCAMQRFVATNGQTSGTAAAVATEQGELAADVFIVAAGALTPFLADELGCPIPIQPGKGYSLTMPRPQHCPQIPLIFPEHRVAVTPMLSGYRLGSIMEFAGYDDSMPVERLNLLRDGARPYLREPSVEPVVEQWYGWRPMTYDSRPIIDRSPRWSNVWVAAGHNMLGLSMAPATGKLMAELVNGQPPHLDPQPFSIQRFR